MLLDIMGTGGHALDRAALVHPDIRAVAVLGAGPIGLGVLAMARHHASVGGIGLLALYLHETKGINAGKTQLAADVVIIALAGLVVDLRHLALSILSAAALSLVMIAYHRPGRYSGY